MHFQMALLKGYGNIYDKKKTREIESTAVHCQETDDTELLQQQYRLNKTQRFIPDSVTNYLSRELLCFVGSKDCILAMKGSWAQAVKIPVLRVQRYCQLSRNA